MDKKPTYKKMEQRVRELEKEVLLLKKMKVEHEGEILPPLFSVDSKFQSDLDSNNISEELQQEFEGNGVSLSQDISIHISCFLYPPLFSVDLKFRDDLDNGDRSAELRQEFESNEFPLSHDIKFITQQEEGKWLMRDGDKQYHIKESEDSLDVHTVEHKVWRVDDEDNGREYLVAKVDDGRNVYSIPDHGD